MIDCLGNRVNPKDVEIRYRLWAGYPPNKSAGHFCPALSLLFKILLLGFFSTHCLRLSDSPALLADFEAREAAYRDVFAQLADLCGDQLRDADGLFLDEGLIKQAHFLVELRHLAFDRS